MKVTIKNRFSGAVLFECELPAELESESASKQLGYAVKQARLRGAYLGGADLGGAYLRGAYLRGAYLGDAYLGGADLRGADLRGAYLGDAYLGGAMGLPDNLSAATEETPEQRRERETARAARFRERFPDIPVVPQLDARILAAIEAKPEQFDMRGWHGTDEPGPACETTHCRAGWAIHLAGEAGYALEKKFDAAYAGRMIYLVSTGYHPDFYTDNDTALADIKSRAAEQVTP